MEFRVTPPVTFAGAAADKFGRPWIRVVDDRGGGRAIFWTCPACYRGLYGRIGHTPISGWENPRWTEGYGANGGLTLFPSLGCPGLRDGSCTGHWWVRDGELVAA